MYFVTLGIEETITIPLSHYHSLLERLSSFESQLLELRQTVASLQEENRLLRNGKNSGTSHTPPSHHLGRPNAVSLRVKTGKKSGGQPGHEGGTLRVKAVPDEVIDHIPDYCTGCGADIGHVAAVPCGARQEVVLPPPPQARYVEHRSFGKTCTRCGKYCTGGMPPHLTAPIQYGGSVAALVSYLSVYQYLPYHRTSVLLKDLFGLHISGGGIDNLLEKAARQALPAYGLIRKRIQQSPVVGSDETGTSVGGKKGWFHAWQTLTLTFIAASMNRGFKTIEQYFPGGFPVSVYVSDCWAAQLKVKTLLHQLCTAHLLRELRNFEDALCCKWSAAMRQLLAEAIALKKCLLPQDYLLPPPTVTAIEQRLGQLLEYDASADHKKVQAFVKRLVKNKDSILTFLRHADVPPDNNGSERAIRNIKVKTKISGQFKSERGATRFAILRSVIDTAIKNSQDILNALNTIGNLQPE